MKAQGLPVLPHQKDALEKAGHALNAIRPLAATDLSKAMERRPELVAEAAGGRSQKAMRAQRLRRCENGGAKLDHGGGGEVLLRAA